MQNNSVTVISRKYDLSVRRIWKCRLIERRDPLLVFVGEFDQAVEHADLGLIEKDTVSYEYYWLDRWYNVFRFHTPSGEFRNFYCNINMPPKFEDGVLHYIDLDIDVIAWPDGRVVTLDEAEFRSNAAQFHYPETVQTKARFALAELSKLIRLREFPFQTMTRGRLQTFSIPE